MIWKFFFSKNKHYYVVVLVPNFCLPARSSSIFNFFCTFSSSLWRTFFKKHAITVANLIVETSVQWMASNPKQVYVLLFWKFRSWSQIVSIGVLVHEMQGLIIRPINRSAAVAGTVRIHHDNRMLPNQGNMENCHQRFCMHHGHSF